MSFWRRRLSQHWRRRRERKDAKPIMMLVGAFRSRATHPSTAGATA